MNTYGPCEKMPYYKMLEISINAKLKNFCIIKIIFFNGKIYNMSM